MSKVAFIIQRYGLEVNGGAEYYTRLVAEKLAAAHDVEIITTCALDYATWENHYKPGTEEINGVNVRRFLTSTPEMGLAHTAPDEQWINSLGGYAPGITEHIKTRKHEYDAFIAVTYCFFPTVTTLTAAPEKSIFIPCAHNEPALYYPNTPRIFGGSGARTAPAFFMFLTDEERALVQKVFRNHKIPNNVAGVGIDLPADINAGLFRDKFNISNDFCIYVGRLDYGKSTGALFHYFMEYKKRNKNNLKLIVMGKSLPNEERPESKDIIHLGFVSEQDKFDGMAAAKVLCLSSMLESLSLVVLEAFSLGVPVIVNEYSDVLKGHCEKSNAGLYYKNYFEFEGALNFLLAEKDARKTMSQNAKEYVKTRYTWDITLGRFESAIEFVKRGT